MKYREEAMAQRTEAWLKAEPWYGPAMYERPKVEQPLLGQHLLLKVVVLVWRRGGHEFTYALGIGLN